jgi:small-conductance mechanosensitive channel
VLDEILAYLKQPFVVLSGTPVTALSIVTAIGIVIVARIIAGIVARSVGRVFVARGAEHGLEFAIGKIIRYAITILGVFVAVSTIGVNMSAVFAAGAVLLVGIGFGLQKMAENFISGLILLVERPVRKGDFIEVSGAVGTVVDIGLRATEVHTRDGITIFVPNGELVSGTVINHSFPTTTMRIWVKIGVAYGSDLDLVRRLLLEVAREEKLVVNEPPPEVRHDGFGSSQIDLALVCWIAQAKDDLVALSRMRFAIDRVFRANHISIPFPQHDVHIRTSTTTTSSSAQSPT